MLLMMNTISMVGWWRACAGVFSLKLAITLYLTMSFRCIHLHNEDLSIVFSGIRAITPNKNLIISELAASVRYVYGSTPSLVSISYTKRIAINLTQNDHSSP